MISEQLRQEEPVQIPPPPAGAQRLPPGARLWRNRDFNIFWFGQSLSALGDAFGVLAMPLLVLEATGSVAQMGLVTGTFGIGQLISGFLSGPLVDKVDRRRLMIVCDLGRMFLYSSVPLVWAFAGPQLWLIYVVAGLGALLGNTFGVAYITAVSNLVDKDQLTEANSRLEASYGIVFFVGPMLAGFVSHLFGPATAIGIDAVSFLISAISLVFIRLRVTREEEAPVGEQQHESFLQVLLAGLRFVWRQPVLRAMTLLLCGVGFLTFGALDLFVYYLKSNLGQNDSAVGIVLGVGSIGMIVGSLSASRLKLRWGYGACWIVTCFIEGAMLAPVGLMASVVAITLAAAAHGAAQSIRGIVSMSFRQEITPDRLLGRVTAAFWTLITIPGPIGAALMTYLAQQIGATPVILLMGTGIMALAVVAAFTPIRTQMGGRAGQVSSTGQTS